MAWRVPEAIDREVRLQQHCEVRSQEHSDFIIGFVLALLALVWRLYYGINRGLPSQDEVWSAVTAFHILQHPGFVPFQVGTDYMGTVQEYAMAGLMMLMGVNEMSLRLPAALFFAAAVFITHNTISREISREYALASGILMAASNSAVVFYTGGVATAYPAIIFLAAAIAWHTFQVDRSRTLVQWMLLGALAGFGASLFQNLILQIMASLAFLATRSTLFDRLRSVARNWAFWTMVVSGIVACVLLLAVVYHFLTRRATYVAGPLDLALLYGGLLLAGVFTILLVRILKPCRADLVAIGSFSIVFVIFQAIPNLWFKYHELPSLVADHAPLWQAGTYSLKHMHEWLDNACLLFNYVLPPLAVGRMGSLSDWVSEPCPIDAVGFVSAAGILLIVVLLVRHFQFRKRLMLACPESVFILPLLIFALALFPSWRLVTPFSYRYMVVFVPGLCLGSVIAVRAIANRAILFGLVGVYALYSGYDCLANLQFAPPDKDCVDIAAQLLERHIDGALVNGKCRVELAWLTAGRVAVADGDADANDTARYFLYPRPSSIAAVASIAAVNLDEARLSRILGRSAAEFRPAERLSPGVVVYRRKPSDK
jgi:hypothetical protein